jgi:UPF0755 protein
VIFRLPTLGEGTGGRRRVLLLGAAGLSGLAALWAVWVLFNWIGPGPSRAETTVVLSRGGGVGEIAVELRQAHVIRSPGLFRLFAKFTHADRTLRAGEYDFPAHASLARVLGMMARGEIVRHWVTVAEGRTSAQVVALLDASPVLEGSVETPPEGSILPQTYEVARGESRQDVIDAMRKARDAVLDRLWAQRVAGLPVRTPEEAVILASIVEKETSVPSERARIAAVYENRLIKGMRLEADPVVIYGVSRGESLGHGLTKAELQTPTPYNSYLVAGLPPTPIANPGEASLEAVLHPARTDDLYFVADGTGGHAFSANWEEHQRNVARWRAIEASRKPGAMNTTQAAANTIKMRSGR